MDQHLQHPSALISQDDTLIIRDHAAQAERLGILQPEQLAVVYRNKWFKLLVPRPYGGLQVTLPELVRLQEAISWADGSTGWVVTLCSGAGWFGGFMDASFAKPIFDEEQVCLAGSGAVGGTAKIIPSGYLVNGSWKYASGAHHATHITANCAITKNGEPVVGDDGEPLVLPFIFDKNDVTMLPAWKYTGMVATGSDAFKITDLTVASNRQFKIDPLAVIAEGVLYRYPFLQLAEATLAVNMSGMAIHFIDLCADVFKSRMDHPRLTTQHKAILIDELALANKRMYELRKPFFEAVDESWLAINTDSLLENSLKDVSLTSRKLAIHAREIVDKLYPLCGLIAASTDSEINRAWRDLHTASQHSLLTFAT